MLQQLWVSQGQVCSRGSADAVHVDARFVVEVDCYWYVK